MAQPAMAEPDNDAKRVPPPTAKRLKRPGIRPSHLSITSIAFGATPDRNMISPMRTKRGTGSKEKVETDL
jgi:hypothetical protein